MTRSLILFVATLTVLLLVAPSETDAGRLSFGPQVGYTRAPDAEDGRFTGGAALRAQFLPMLGAEASIQYRQDDYFADQVTVRTWPVTVTGLVYPVPFVYGALGAGWYNVTFDANGDFMDLDEETEQEFGWHLGFGVELPLNPSVALTGEFRYTFLDVDFGELPAEVQNRDADFYVMSVGLLFGASN